MTLTSTLKADEDASQKEKENLSGKTCCDLVLGWPLIFNWESIFDFAGERREFGGAADAAGRARLQEYPAGRVEHVRMDQEEQNPSGAQRRRHDPPLQPGSDGSLPFFLFFLLGNRNLDLVFLGPTTHVRYRTATRSPTGIPEGCSFNWFGRASF